MNQDASLGQLINDIDRERVERARRMSVEQRFLAGFELFKRSMALMRAGIKSDFPSATDAEVRAIIRQRLAKLEEGIPYRP